MDCSDASVDFCTALRCLIHGEKSKQAAKVSTNFGRKRAQQHLPEVEEEKSSAPKKAIAVVASKKRELKKVEMPVVGEVVVEQAHPCKSCAKSFTTSGKLSSHTYSAHTLVGMEKQQKKNAAMLAKRKQFVV